MKAFKQTFKYFKEYSNDILLKEVDEVYIKRYLEYRLKNSSAYQARKDKINLSSLFTRAVEWGYIEYNSCRKVKNIPIPEKQPIYFSKTEFLNLIDLIKDKDLRDIVIFAVNTGLRQSELLALEWQQINLDNKLLILNNQNHLTKTKKVRSIPLNTNAMEILNNRDKSLSLVFTFNGKTISQNALSIRFRYLLNTNGFRKGLNFHSLRHTFASWLVQSEVSIYVISKLLGHSNIKTTEIYAHLENRILNLAVDKL